MSSPVRRGLYRAVSVLAGLFVGLVLCEAAVRLLLPASDVPYWEPDPNVGYRHPAHLEGNYVAGGRKARFRLNNRGWNSPIDYTRARTPGVPRIAIVGDSYVEALQVDVEKGLGPALQRLFASEGRRVEVYTYGISGASAAYALQLIRSEVVKDRPDVIVYLFINNDVADSVAFLKGQAFEPRFTLDASGHLAALPLAPYRPNVWSRAASRSAVFRYFWVNRGLGTTGRTQRNRAGNDARTAEQDPSQVGIYDEESPAWHKAWQVVGGLLAQMRTEATRRGVRLLVVNRPHPRNFYPGPGPADPNRPERRLAQLAAVNHVDFMDLRPFFSEDWNRHHERFDFADDSHWSEHGHAVAALALKDILTP